MAFRLSIPPPDWFPFATGVSMPNAEGYRKAFPVVQYIGTRAQVALRNVARGGRVCLYWLWKHCLLLSIFYRECGALGQISDIKPPCTPPRKRVSQDCQTSAFAVITFWYLSVLALSKFLDCDCSTDIEVMVVLACT